MSTSKRPRFSQIREEAEERAATLEFDGGMTRKEAEREVKAWAMREYSVALGIVQNAEEDIPLSGLTGRVFWPVVMDSEIKLTDDEILDCLEVASLRARKRHESKVSEEVADLFQDAILKRLAAQHSITVPVDRLLVATS